MPHDETTPPGNSTGTPDQFLGLAEDVNFADALEAKLLEERPNRDIRHTGAVLVEHGINLDPAIAPHSIQLEKFTDADWETVERSEVPLLTLHAAANYHQQVNKTEYVGVSGRRAHDDPRAGYDGLTNRAEIASLPLIHGMTAASFVQLAESGAPMQSNKGRYKASEQDALTFHGTRQGATNLSDRELGLDQYVFFDFGRPAAIHRDQAEITLVVDPAVMDQPGVFMTEQDIADTTNNASYVHGLTTPEYFRETALLRIYNTVTERGEDGRQGYAKFNTIHQWRAGEDGDLDLGHHPMFSTYEVKVPDPPGVPVEAVRRVVVRDQAMFDHLQGTMGDRFEFVHAKLRQAGGIKEDYQGDPRDIAAIDNGNYKEVLQIPGLYEENLEALMEADYQERAAALDGLPDDQKEQIVMVFGSAEPDTINGDNITTRITQKTNPYKYNGRNLAVYSSMDRLREDVEQTNPSGYEWSTVAGQQPWFFDPLGMSGGQKRIQTPSGNCVLATVERSKQNPRVSRVLDAREFSLGELQTQETV